MPHYLTQQPDGKYAVYSTIVNDFVLESATEAQLYQFYREDAIESADRNTKRMLTKLHDYNELTEMARAAHEFHNGQ